MTWLRELFDYIGRLRCWYTVRPWEAALRIRAGKHVRPVGPGLHFRVPLLDEVAIQGTRLRVLNLPLQTCLARDGSAITVSAVVSWRIADLFILYNKLHVPEDWIYNATLSAIARASAESVGAEITAKRLCSAAKADLDRENPGRLGLHVEEITITDLARVRTYRLLTGEAPHGWTWNRMGSLEPTVKA